MALMFADCGLWFVVCGLRFVVCDGLRFAVCGLWVVVGVWWFEAGRFRVRGFDCEDEDDCLLLFEYQTPHAPASIHTEGLGERQQAAAID